MLIDPNKEITLKDIPLLNTPEWLGIDRALGSWGAFQKAKSKGERRHIGPYTQTNSTHRPAKR